MNSITVSVCMITFGHEKYIRDAIEGVLMQKCDFKVELIVVNDCSLDDTDKAVDDILRVHKNASWIKYIKQEQNIGMMPNFIFAINQCSGKYIALCEGDDYWTDPLKLQKQVDFLDANLDFVISHTDFSQTVDGSGVFIEIKNIHDKDVLTINDLLEKNYISTLTCVFRNKLFKEFPKEFYDLKVGDWSLFVLIAQYGKIKYHKGWVSSVYRIHDGGIWSKQQHITKYIAYAEVYKFFKQILEEKFHKKIKQKIIDYYFSAASFYIAKKNKKDALLIIKEIEKEKLFFYLKYLKIKVKYLLIKK